MQTTDLSQADTVTQDAVVIERIVNAPVELVWQLWTESEHFKRWYGPKGASVPVADMDVRVGGKRLVCMAMRTPNGDMQMWFTGEYLEVIPHQRLVYTESMADEQGHVIAPSAMGMPDDHPERTQVTVVLENLDGRTKMTMTHAGVPANSGGAGGWEQAFAKMTDYIETTLQEQLG